MASSQQLKMVLKTFKPLFTIIHKQALIATGPEKELHALIAQEFSTRDNLLCDLMRFWDEVISKKRNACTATEWLNASIQCIDRFDDSLFDEAPKPPTQPSTRATPVVRETRSSSEDIRQTKTPIRKIQQTKQSPAPTSSTDVFSTPACASANDSAPTTAPTKPRVKNNATKGSTRRTRLTVNVEPFPIHSPVCPDAPKLPFRNKRCRDLTTRRLALDMDAADDPSTQQSTSPPHSPPPIPRTRRVRRRIGGDSDASDDDDKMDDEAEWKPTAADVAELKHDADDDAKLAMDVDSDDSDAIDVAGSAKPARSKTRGPEQKQHKSKFTESALESEFDRDDIDFMLSAAHEGKFMLVVYRNNKNKEEVGIVSIVKKDIVYDDEHEPFVTIQWFFAPWQSDVPKGVNRREIVRSVEHLPELLPWSSMLAPIHVVSSKKEMGDCPLAHLGDIDYPGAGFRRTFFFNRDYKLSIDGFIHEDKAVAEAASAADTTVDPDSAVQTGKLVSAVMDFIPKLLEQLPVNKRIPMFVLARTIQKYATQDCTPFSVLLGTLSKDEHIDLSYTSAFWAEVSQRVMTNRLQITDDMSEEWHVVRTDTEKLQRCWICNFTKRPSHQFNPLSMQPQIEIRRFDPPHLHATRQFVGNTCLRKVMAVANLLHPFYAAMLKWGDASAQQKYELCKAIVVAYNTLMEREGDLKQSGLFDRGQVFGK